jgi:speckle-type POZ protein
MIRCVQIVVIDSGTRDNETNSVIVALSNLHQDYGEMLSDGEGADITFTMDG